jgi:hypothetical protein
MFTYDKLHFFNFSITVVLDAVAENVEVAHHCTHYFACKHFWLWGNFLVLTWVLIALLHKEPCKQICLKTLKSEFFFHKRWQVFHGDSLFYPVTAAEQPCIDFFKLKLMHLASSLHCVESVLNWGWLCGQRFTSRFFFLCLSVLITKITLKTIRLLII